MSLGHDMMVITPFPIGNRRVGPGERTFVIAEAGVNHDGDPAEALRLVQKAHGAGADCVKFQTFKAERVASASAPKAPYQMVTTDQRETQVEMLRRLELRESDHMALIKECERLGIVFLSTPYNREDVDFLAGIGTPALKLASIHAAEPDFVNYAARTGRPLILSTGMATLAEVDEAVRAIRDAGNPHFVVLQCTTNYPSAPGDANLRAMTTMHKALGCAVGYSDHTEGDVACIAAVALGACVLEKHFTSDRRRPGPDHAASLEPDAFAVLVRNVRTAQLCLGSALKVPAPAEQANAPYMRRSLVAARGLKAGEVLSAEMLTMRRPGTGIRAGALKEVLGKRLARDVAKDEILTWEALGLRSN
jgi:N,N'-diacetyllegionaminate synthase